MPSCPPPSGTMTNIDPIDLTIDDDDDTLPPPPKRQRPRAAPPSTPSRPGTLARPAQRPQQQQQQPHPVTGHVRVGATLSLADTKQRQGAASPPLSLVTSPSNSDSPSPSTSSDQHLPALSVPPTFTAVPPKNRQSCQQPAGNSPSDPAAGTTAKATSARHGTSASRPLTTSAWHRLLQPHTSRRPPLVPQCDLGPGPEAAATPSLSGRTTASRPAAGGCGGEQWLDGCLEVTGSSVSSLVLVLLLPRCLGC